MAVWLGVMRSRSENPKQNVAFLVGPPRFVILNRCKIRT